MFKKMLCLLIAAALALCAIAAAAESENLPDAGQEQAATEGGAEAVTAAEPESQAATGQEQATTEGGAEAVTAAEPESQAATGQEQTAKSKPTAVTAAELEGLLATVREEAAAETLLNDPTDEAARSEDGTLFLYEVAQIYAEGETLTADTPVNTLVFEDSEGPVFRGTGIDTHRVDLLAAFRLDNQTLGGTREQALLYLSENADGGFLYGTALRDGQRLTAVKYGEMIKNGDGYRDVSVTYSLLNSLVTAIRADGLNPSATIDAQQAEETLAGLKALGTETGYRMVANSRIGTDLTAFSAEDLSFSGIRYTELTPETLPGEAEKELIDNEDGTWLMRCDGDGFEAVFTCDGDGGNAKILSYTILDPDAEGPRAVRLGDLMSDDYCRFRSEGNEMTEEMTEVLYGTEESGEFGLASFDYSAGEASLRYGTEADGTRVELLLKYEQNQLKEIILHTV